MDRRSYDHTSGGMHSRCSRDDSVGYDEKPENRNGWRLGQGVNASFVSPRPVDPARDGNLLSVGIFSVHKPGKARIRRKGQIAELLHGGESRSESVRGDEEFKHGAKGNATCEPPAMFFTLHF